MKKIAWYSIVLLMASGIGLASATGAQVLTPDVQTKSPELQNDNAKYVRIAIIDSPKAFKESTEGKRFLVVADKLSKKKQEEEVARIRVEMVAIIKNIAKEKGYGLVLDLGTSGIVCWSLPVDDITDELVERYNASKR